MTLAEGRRVFELRLEYQQLSARMRVARTDVERMRLEAREIEIVDSIREIGIEPDVLIASP